MKKAKDYAEYKAAYPKEIQKLLDQVRATIKKAAPAAEEVISYGMPAFKQNRILVYFAAQSKHIGLYPTASGVANFKKELAGYEFSKGAIQFPYDKPLPLALITKIVKFRVAENKAK
ncbi:MAG TPA: DUF1801 domain-containing protein [Bacteroidia bacterium]|nr:DUF1801 domain-containing protein [Bacteroidia bacterium]